MIDNQEKGSTTIPVWEYLLSKRERVGKVKIMQCQLCNENVNVLGVHIKIHNISPKQYYDLFYKTSQEGICPVCSKETTFLGLTKGYRIFCSNSCSALYNQNRKDVRDKTKHTLQEKYQITCACGRGNSSYRANQTKKALMAKYGVDNPFYLTTIQEQIQNTKTEKRTLFEQENKCTRMKTLVNLYGEGWKQNKQLNIPRIYYCNSAFIPNEYIPIIKEYYNSHIATTDTLPEQEIVKCLMGVYPYEIIRHIRTIISPYELDIYLPHRKLAIEYNGTYWHSKVPKDYHLKKSLLCREKGIRLIHIYGFENFEEQLSLLTYLIMNEDRYPKDDFNKNNLIDIIPTPSIIYNKECVVYGAGNIILSE